MVSVAVIGDRKCKRDTCISWSQPFPNIEEFDSLIVNLTSFPEDSLDEAVLKHSIKSI